jgi:DNA-binding beta-propeller fold protein YncE
MIARLLGSRRRRALSAWVACVGVLLALPGLALADHVFLPGYFPPPMKKKPGEIIPVPLLPENALTGFETPAVTFDDACGLAVQASGAEVGLYVADHYHDVVDRFKFQLFKGHLIGAASEGRAWEAVVKDNDPNGAPCGLAWSPAGLYVNDYRRGVTWYDNSFLATEIDSGPASGVAVDPSTNFVYVTHPTYVAVYELDGTPVDDESAEPLHIGLGPLGEAYGVAVSNFPATKGYVYVADASDETVKVFDPATSTTTPIETIDGSLGPQQGFRDLRDSALAIDQSNGNLLVSDRLAEAEEPPMVIDEFTAGGNFRGQLPQAMGDGEPAGIAVDPVSHVIYVSFGRRDHSGVYAFGPATPSHALLAVKAGAGQGTVTTNPVGISCPASCAAGEAEFATGSAVALNAVAAPHSSFGGWTVTGQPGACPGTGACQVQLGADTEVVANFAAIPQQNLTVTVKGDGEGAVLSEPAGIECGASCSEHFDEGSTVALTATPEPRSHFAGWSVAGSPSACQSPGPCEVTLDQATAVSAEFAHNPDRTLSIAVTGQGRVISAPQGIDCAAQCSNAFADGSRVTLQAVPAPGYELLSWSGACSGKRGCTVEMDEDRSAAATFVLIEDALAVSVIGTGSGTVSDPSSGIDCGLTCAGIYKNGSVLTLTATAEEGSRFLGFNGCDSVSGATCTVTVTEAKTVVAMFGEAPEIAVRKATAHGRTVILSVNVPSPGVLQASGRDIVAKKLKADSEGFVTLRLSLSARGARHLRQADAGKLSIRVSLLFTSADGSTASAKKIVTLQRKGRR